MGFDAKTALCAATIALMAIGAPVAQSGKQKPTKQKTEKQAKAELIYHLCNYVRWGDLKRPADKPFRIAIVGADPFGKKLDAVFKKGKVGRLNKVKRTASITRLGAWKDLDPKKNEQDKVLDCELLLITETDPATIQAITKKVGTAKVLTVAMHPKFLHHGGDIELYVAKKRVRFEIDIVNVRGKSMDVSSQMLKRSATNPASGPKPKPEEKQPGNVEDNGKDNVEDRR